MQIHVIVGALSFCIFGLGLFLGGEVRPILMIAMKSDPALIGPILTRMFSWYNLVALVLSALSLILETITTRSPARSFIAAALTLILALKLPFDKLIQRREGLRKYVESVTRAGGWSSFTMWWKRRHS
jgi:hypothetical protein